MKKIFLAAGILAFSFATAQQNDFLDIQKQIQKKLKEDQKQKLREQLLSFQNVHRLTSQQSTLPQAKFLQVLPNGNKVYALPQDHTPCIVPDMKQFNMPNITRRNDVSGRMPNAIIPYKIIPGEIKKWKVPH